MVRNVDAGLSSDRCFVLDIQKKLDLKSENKKHFLVTLMTFVIYTPFLLGANYFSKETQILQILTVIFISIYVLIYFLLAPRGFLRNE